jgi:hypothetical protein
MVRFLRVPAASVTGDTSTGNNAMPQCSFTARARTGARAEVIANVDTSPSPYFRLERTAVETYQVFAPTRVLPAPLPVSGLGLDAYWFPAKSQLMSTDGVRLITASVSWPHVDQARERQLAEAVSRPYLKTPRGKAANSLAKGYPSI